MKYFSHLNTATNILQQYKGEKPFSQFIKDFFRQHKKFGSTDRKTISHLCYCYFRLGHALKDLPTEEKILTGIFLCNHSSNDLLAHFKPEWNNKISIAAAEKLSITDYQLSITDIFPWKDELSEGIDHEKFCESFLVQPDLFLRIRPGNEQIVKKKLTNANIKFRQLNDSCIALNNSTSIDKVIEVNKEAVVQDYSSQRVGDFIEPLTGDHKPQTFSVWDCCAASGGKSIMVRDVLGDIDLTVSDIRKSILINLKKRLTEAGMKKFHSFITDLTSLNYKPLAKNFDLIIADVPCSGSGTWGRTPEVLSFFNEKEIDSYNELQKKIVANIIPSLKKGGKLVYITCSVFKKENEEVIDFVRQKFHLQVQKMEVLKGYDQKADTMFAASLVHG